MRPRCVLCAGFFGAALLLAGCRSGPAEPPDVLLITLDTTRRDHLGFYGAARPTSPNFDELAREAVVYTEARSTSSWTLPSHASLFTGLWPHSHGAGYGSGEGVRVAGRDPDAGGVPPVRPLGPEPATLAEMLDEQGYATGAVVAGPYMNRAFGVARGFASYHDSGVTSGPGLLAEEVTDQALSWLEANAGRPRFLFLNYFDPHVPYYPPPSFRSAFLDRAIAARVGPTQRNLRDAVALYDAEILYMDQHLGRLFRHLRDTGAWERTLVIVTSDHGEMFGEQGLFGHGQGLWEPQLRIPFVVKPPGSTRHRTDETPVSLVDVVPIVLDAVGVEQPESVQGSLPRRRGENPLLAELGHGWKEGRLDTRALYQPPYKIQWNRVTESKLFDLSIDPDEQDDLAARKPEVLARMQHELDSLIESLPAAPPPPEEDFEIDPVLREALERMGYVE